MIRAILRLLQLLALLAAIAAPAAAQNCGWSRIDHRVAFDDSGIWNPNVYRGVVGALTLAQIGGAIYEGSETRFGKTMWQAMDSEIISAVTANVSKYAFTRVRPSNTDNPCLWFQGGSNYSFPSGEAATAAGLVTPYVLEYGSEHPAAYGLLLLPVYVGVGRVKNHAHWQSDVLAGWAIGGVSGWYAHSRDVPILVEVLPHGAAVGWHKEF
ncbi:MAG TPA: phosphatase PAP2 family protein [Burkholderiales bacterium]|nr:phosphatase PAP2 family protein [Burkholderiales bacterium]